MRRAAARTLMLAALAAAFAGIGATGANAAILPPSTARSIESAFLSDGSVFWFQRYIPGRRRWSWDDRGEIFRRDLAGSAVERVYRASPGHQIQGFNAAGGRIAVGIAWNDGANTAVLELVKSAAGWSAKPLVVASADPLNGVCGRRVELVDVTPAGEVILDERDFEGAQGDCYSLLREHSQLVAIARDGSQRQLASRTNGWARSDAGSAYDDLRRGAGPWYLTSTSSWSSDTQQGLTGAFNRETGEVEPFPEQFVDVQRGEIGEAGQILLTLDARSRFAAAFYADPHNLRDPLVLGRARERSWYHICGDRLLELTRRRAGRHSAAGSMWNIWLRGFDGVTQRRLPVRLRQSTAFETCDAGTAVFHHRLRHGRVRQFSVALN